MEGSPLWLLPHLLSSGNQHISVTSRGFLCSVLTLGQFLKGITGLSQCNVGYKQQPSSTAIAPIPKCDDQRCSQTLVSWRLNCMTFLPVGPQWTGMCYHLSACGSETLGFWTTGKKVRLGALLSCIACVGSEGVLLQGPSRASPTQRRRPVWALLLL